MQAVLGQASGGGERGQSPEARSVSPRLNGDVKARCQGTKTKKTEKMVEWGSREQIVATPVTRIISPRVESVTA